VGIWGARVLVVEDDPEMLEAAARLLRARGADVITVPTAGAALATVIGVIPDVIVVDVTMPGLDAIGLLRAVRALSPEKGGQVPAIIFGACGLAKERREVTRKADVQGHLTKPIDPAKLVTMVDRLAGLAVERRHRALDRRHWPRDVSRERRAEVREGLPVGTKVEKDATARWTTSRSRRASVVAPSTIAAAPYADSIRMSAPAPASPGAGRRIAHLGAGRRATRRTG
jgi:CheY-like chemotaxis protein